jgi:ATP-dependent DNA helicase RecG
MDNYLDTSIEFLKGVGPKKASLLNTELGIFKFSDLIFYFPFRHIDRSKFYRISEIDADYPYVQFIARVRRVELIEGKGRRLVVSVFDNTGALDLVFFQSIRWMKDYLKPGADYIIFGKPTVYKSTFNFVHPEVELYTENARLSLGGLQPVYHSTEKLKAAGLDSRGISRLTHTLFSGFNAEFKETLPASILESLKLMPRNQAIRMAHMPQNAELLQKAMFRLKFEELFYVRLKLLLQNQAHKTQFKGYQFGLIGDYFNDFYAKHLKFELTGAQKRVLKEIRRDLSTGAHMNRLLQGDVGSGKTIVALMTMLMALDNGFQACLMAPTEILATQHYQSIKELLEPMNLEVGLLTGSTKKSQRNKIHAALQSGDLKILIGTHALLEEQVKFLNLGLAVIDEQHRFGVAQRAEMWKKNTLAPHILVMTATPIPRTLAMTLYGDLDVSVIDELPPGRKPIETRHFFENKRLSVIKFMKREIEKGRQVYVVYPLIEGSEKMDYKHLQEGYEAISRDFPGIHISMVHGKLRNEEKEFEMQRFVKNQTKIMVATTVIEVGVNVPNASIMVIENAERFGLSQLHQLRGRVGRGAEQSYCILMTDYKLSSEARVRMETMVRTNDGFEIAETDLKLRGPGDIEGTRQSGILDLKIADLAKDQKILAIANSYAVEILELDPGLAKPENAILRSELAQKAKNNTGWERIS